MPQCLEKQSDEIESRHIYKNICNKSFRLFGKSGAKCILILTLSLIHCQQYSMRLVRSCSKSAYFRSRKSEPPLLVTRYDQISSLGASRKTRSFCIPEFPGEFLDGFPVFPSAPARVASRRNSRLNSIWRGYVSIITRTVA